jgi:hypothetical protein
MSDVTGNGAGYPNGNGSSIFPGTQFTGPITAGNINATSGTALASLGATAPGYMGNAGFAVMAQSAVITQTASALATSIVIPAQSQILRIILMVTTAWTTGTTTLGIGATAGTTNATAFTSATGVAGGTAGQVSATPSTTAQIANWDNVSNSTFQSVPVDVQIEVTSGGGAGSGVGTLTVEYLQGINLAS